MDGHDDNDMINLVFRCKAYKLDPEGYENGYMFSRFIRNWIEMSI